MLNVQKQRRLLYAIAIASGTAAIAVVAFAIFAPLHAALGARVESRFQAAAPVAIVAAEPMSLDDFEFTIDKRFRNDTQKAFATDAERSTGRLESVHRLVGTMIEEGQSIAILQTEDGTQARRVGEMAGSPKDGLQVVEIAATTVTLRHASGSREVVLKFDEREGLQ